MMNKVYCVVGGFYKMEYASADYIYATPEQALKKLIDIYEDEGDYYDTLGDFMRHESVRIISWTLNRQVKRKVEIPEEYLDKDLKALKKII